jgi:hypothetical protein
MPQLRDPCPHCPPGQGFIIKREPIHPKVPGFYEPPGSTKIGKGWDYECNGKQKHKWNDSQ